MANQFKDAQTVKASPSKLETFRRLRPLHTHGILKVTRDQHQEIFPHVTKISFMTHIAIATLGYLFISVVEKIRSRRQGVLVID